MRAKFLVILISLLLAVGGTGYLVFSWFRTTDPDYRLRKGQEAARAGNYEEAVRYARLLEDDSEINRALLLRGEILLRQKEYSEAHEVLNQISDQGAIRLDATALQGECLYHLGQRQEAERALRFVLSENPRHVDAHRFLAAIYFDQGDLTIAVGHLREVANLDPNDAKPHRLIGLIYKDLDQMPEAIAAYQEAMRRNPPPALRDELQTELAECLFKTGAYETVLATLNGIGGDMAAAIRAETLIKLDRSAEASVQIDEALPRYPANATLLRLRGQLFLESKQPDEARKVLERALQVDPSDFRCRYQFALALGRLGKSEEAKAQHEQVKEAQRLFTEMTDLIKEASGRPWDGEVRLRLAAICDKLHKPQLATMWRNAAAACARLPQQ